MDGERGLFDASAYMLFEASGDSEAECFGGAAEEEHDAAAEDDAQSCSYGRVSHSGGVQWVGACEGDFKGDDCREEESGVDDEEENRIDDEEEEEEEEEDDDNVVDQWKAAVAKEKLNKWKASEDSNGKVMNEMEKDRLFWEACLAS